MRRQADADKLGLLTFQLLKFGRKFEKVIVRRPVIRRKLGLLKNDPAQTNLFQSGNTGMAKSANISKTRYARRRTFPCSRDRRCGDIVIGHLGPQRI